MKKFLNTEVRPLPDTVKAGDVLEGVQICPQGDWPHGEIVQHCSAEAFDKIVSSQTGEILVDFEHNAETGGDTTAAAWITNLRFNEASGLIGDFKFTDIGAEAVSRRRLRFLSPAFECEETGEREYTPVRLKSVALTNKPNIPVHCVLNREGLEVSNVEDKPKDPSMDKIKELLGLGAEASEEDVIAAITSLKEEVSTLNSEKEEAEAEAFAKENEEILNKEDAKKAYLLNKEAAKALVAGVKKPVAKTQQVVLNRGVSQFSAPKSFAGDARKELASLPVGERAAFYAAHKSEIDN